MTTLINNPSAQSLSGNNNANFINKIRVGLGRKFQEDADFMSHFFATPSYNADTLGAVSSSVPVMVTDAMSPFAVEDLAGTNTMQKEITAGFNGIIPIGFHSYVRPIGSGTHKKEMVHFHSTLGYSQTLSLIHISEPTRPY